MHARTNFPDKARNPARNPAGTGATGSVYRAHMGPRQIIIPWSWWTFRFDMRQTSQIWHTSDYDNFKRQLEIRRTLDMLDAKFLGYQIFWSIDCRDHAKLCNSFLQYNFLFQFLQNVKSDTAEVTCCPFMGSIVTKCLMPHFQPQSPWDCSTQQYIYLFI